MSRVENVRVERGFTASTVSVERWALGVLTGRFEGRRLPVARSIYLALVELADAGRFEATRAVLAEYAGVTKRALDEYVPDFEEAGLLERERRSDEDGRSAPHVWWLLRPAVGGEGEAAAGGAVRFSPLPSSPTESSSSGDEGPGVQQLLPPQQVPPTGASYDGVALAIVEDAEALLRQKRRVDGRVVTVAEMERAAAAIDEFNKAAGSDFGLGAHLTPLVMRLRERPSLDAAKARRLVQSAWRIKWWERNGRKGRRATPAVVFGNAGCFENVVQDAVQEAKGETPAGPGSRDEDDPYTRNDD